MAKNVRKFSFDKEELDAELWFAAANGFKEVVKIALKAGADVNSTETGRTPLMLAAKRGNPQIVEMLLDAGADPKLADVEGQTAEDYAYCKVMLAQRAYDLLKNASGGGQAASKAKMRKTSSKMKDGKKIG